MIHQNIALELLHEELQLARDRWVNMLITSEHNDSKFHFIRGKINMLDELLNGVLDNIESKLQIRDQIL